VELKSYLRITWRWLWMIVALPALVLVLSVGVLRDAPKAESYVATMRFSVGLQPEPVPAGAYAYDRYYTWLTSEYLVDDLSEVVKSEEIAQAVAQEAARQGLQVQIAPGAIQGATQAGKLHRILTVSMTWGNRAELEKLSGALATVLSEGKAPYFDQFKQGGTPIQMQLIDPPTISTPGASLRSKLDLPLRAALALLAGVAVAFFVEYLDDSVQSDRDLRAQGLTVLGIIPKRSRLPWEEQKMR